jgi:multiple sugar transport system ATP-binding protein
VRTVEALGAELIAHLEIAGKPVLTEEVREVAADSDDTVVRGLESEAAHAKLPLVARLDAASRIRPDQGVEVVVDTSRIHVFDLDSGLAVGGHPVGA